MDLKTGVSRKQSSSDFPKNEHCLNHRSNLHERWEVRKYVLLIRCFKRVGFSLLTSKAIDHPLATHMFKGNNGNTRAMCEICFKVNKDTRATLDVCRVLIVNFEQFSHLSLMFLLLNLNRLILPE